jgi:hypothetical protein
LDPNISDKDRIETERLKIVASIALKLEVEAHKLINTMDMMTKITAIALT